MQPNKPNPEQSQLDKNAEKKTPTRSLRAGKRVIQKLETTKYVEIESDRQTVTISSSRRIGRAIIIVSPSHDLELTFDGIEILEVREFFI